MGNNHDKYFGKDKRKIMVLGLPGCGKTTLVQSIVQGKQFNLKVQKTPDLNLRDAKLDGLDVMFVDIRGSQRQRVFWKQHYVGTQGIAFLIDSQDDQENKQTALNEIAKLNSQPSLQGIPIAICLSKSDLANEQDLKVLQKKVSDAAKNWKNMKVKIFRTNFKNQNSIRQMIVWLLKETKPL